MKYFIWTICALGLASTTVAQSSSAPAAVKMKAWGFQSVGFIYRAHSSLILRSVKADYGKLKEKLFDIRVKSQKAAEIQQSESSYAAARGKLRADLTDLEKAQVFVEFKAALPEAYRKAVDVEVEGELLNPKTYVLQLADKAEEVLLDASGQPLVDSKKNQLRVKVPTPGGEEGVAQWVYIDQDGKSLVVAFWPTAPRYRSFLVGVRDTDQNNVTTTYFDSVTETSTQQGERPLEVTFPNKLNLNPTFPIQIKSVNLVATKSEVDPNNANKKINKQYLDLADRGNPTQIVFDFNYDQNLSGNSLWATSIVNGTISTKRLDRQAGIIINSKVYTNARSMLSKGSAFGGLIVQGNPDTTNLAIVGQLGYEIRRSKGGVAKDGVAFGSPDFGRFGPYKELILMPKLSVGLEGGSMVRVDRRFEDTDQDGMKDFDADGAVNLRIHASMTALQVSLGFSVAPKLSNVYLELVGDYWWFTQRKSGLQRRQEAFGSAALIVPLKGDSGLRLYYSGGANAANGFIRSRGTLGAGIVTGF